MKQDGPVIDPYLPDSGNVGYRVRRYELDLNYRVPLNRLSGSATITAEALTTLRSLSLDLSDALAVSKVSVNGARPAQFKASRNKLHIRLASELAPGAAASIAIHYSGSPRPVRAHWGDVGFEELSDGALVAGQPNGAPTWFPCDDRPAAKAGYRIKVTADSAYQVIANGELASRRVRAAQTSWTYELQEPTSTYLATVQIGVYDRVRLPGAPVPMRAALPAWLRSRFDHDFARQPQMMALFVKLFGPYPLSSGYTVVVTDDELEIPVEAQGVSVFGANHCTGGRESELLIAHELAHQWYGNSVTARHWRDIWLHEGFACYAEWLWSQESGGPGADELAGRYHRRLRNAPQDLLLADPGPCDMFDDRVYKRGALTLHALRGKLGDDKFFALLRDWATRYRHSTVVTDDFTTLAAGYTGQSLRPLWDGWLYSTDVP